jgi:hypothetical protein
MKTRVSKMNLILRQPDILALAQRKEFLIGALTGLAA